MRILLSVALLSVLSCAACVQAADADVPAEAEATADVTDAEGAEELTLQQKASYLFGALSLANQVRHFDLDVEMLAAGIRDAMAGSDLLVPEQEAGAVMGAWQQEIESRQGKVGEVNRATSAAYLEEVAGREGIQVTDSGLAYEVIDAGPGGPKPRAADKVRVHYVGRLIDGTVFDSSRQRGQPASFVLSQVIPGWTEGLQLMPVGSSYRFHIPSHLAYGEDAPPNIGPNQALIFEVELLGIE